jgi:hypothetical protein
MTKILLSTVAIASVLSSLHATEVKGKGQLYYYSTDTASQSLFDKESTQSAGAVTLDVTHKVSDAITANFSAVGHSHLGDSLGEGTALATSKMEGSSAGGYFNVANLTATFGDTTVVVGRQLLATPMLGGFDWKLAPGAFEAATVVNNSVDKFTFIASYVNKWRGNDTGDNFTRLADDNYAFGVAYSDAVDANLWFYNVDALAYTQVYTDVSKDLNGVTLSGQAIKTNYDVGVDSTAYGLKVGTALSGLDVAIAYNHVEDRVTGMVGVDSIYTSSWNNFGSQDIGDSWKVEASKEISGVSSSISYADYETQGNELDVILGYTVSDTTSVDAIFTNTKTTENGDANNALELIATYNF